MLTASKYSHYMLFTIPFFASNASFGIYDTFKNKSNNSKLTLRIFAGLMIIIFLVIFLGSIFNLKIFSELSLIESFVISLFSLISIVLSSNLLNKTNTQSFNINKILSIFFIEILILNLLFSIGIVGNPNNDIKKFMYQSDVKQIINNNPIFLIGNLDNKKLYLFKFYIADTQLIETNQIPNKKTIYGIISDKDVVKLNKSNRSKFTKLRKFKDINFIKIN